MKIVKGMVRKISRAPTGNHMKPLSENLSTCLNASRWLAALLVLLDHARHLTFVDLKAAESAPLLYKALYFLTGLGRESVVVFFVVSGFLVGGVTLERWRERGPDLRAYASARISRIYTVLLPALLLGLALDLIGIRFFNASTFYTNPHFFDPAIATRVIADHLDPLTWIGNLLLLQGIAVDNLGSNGALWSLSYEWWYYWLFALIAAAVLGNDRERIVFGGIAVVIVALLPGKILLWGAIWGLGILGHLWVRSGRFTPHPAPSFALLLVALVISRLNHNTEALSQRESLLSEFIRDGAVAITYVAALVSVNRMKLEIPFRQLHDRLAQFSYTAYLCHVPLITLMLAASGQMFGLGFKQQPSPSSVVFLVVVSASVFALCWLISRWTERHTPSIRRQLDHVLSCHRAQPVQ
jgi:peptidoglycan/LPS O-acetylase OafA/YrhL